jgi:hypothetical protein
MVYHIRAAIELRLADHARRLYAGLVALLREHPYLIAEELGEASTFRDAAPAASLGNFWQDRNRNPSRHPQPQLAAATMSPRQSRAMGAISPSP